MESMKSTTWKCRATGKVAFPSRIDAQYAMLRFKLRSRVKNVTNGKRIKHRMGKAACSRAYYCRFCGGYHITKWKKGDFYHYRKTALTWDISSVISDWNYLLE